MFKASSASSCVASILNPENIFVRSSAAVRASSGFKSLVRHERFQRAFRPSASAMSTVQRVQPVSKELLMADLASLEPSSSITSLTSMLESRIRFSAPGPP